jgi:hypothetical protein
MTLQRRLVVSTFILLAVLLSRTVLLHHISFDQDETRSALRSFGTSAEIIAWQPDDWPPVYNLFLGVWQALISPHPLILRISSLLIFLLAASLAYRLAYRVFRNHYAALVTMLAFSALGYSIYLSTYLRAYVLAMVWFPLSVWLALLYFHRPTLRRALFLAASLSVQVYTTYTFMFPFAFVGLCIVAAYPRRLRAGRLPGVLTAVMVLPELARKSEFFTRRVDVAAEITPRLPPLGEGLLQIFREYAGSAFIIWTFLFFAALIIVFIRQRPIKSVTIWMFGSTLLAPLVLYIAAAIPIFYFFAARYSWWALLMGALCIGAGARYLPRIGQWSVVVLMFVLMFYPAPIDYRYNPYPMESVFSALQPHIESGDVLLLDRNFCLRQCEANSEENKFAYYLRIFGEGLELVESPDGYRRVWYLSQDGWQDEGTKADVQAGRIARTYFGPWNFLIRLYEAPPDPEGIPFENGLRFHGMEVIGDDGRARRQPIDLMEGQIVRMRLWWSVDDQLSNEYSISIQFLRGDDLWVNSDGPPQLLRLEPSGSESLPTSMMQWQPGELYVEERYVRLPTLLRPVYPVIYLTAYQWWDGRRLSAPGVNDANLLPLTRVTVWGF